MSDLSEALKNLENHLDQESTKKYVAHLRRWCLFGMTQSREDFDKSVRKLLFTEDQIRCHNNLLLVIFSKSGVNRVKPTRTSTDESAYECDDYVDYLQPVSPACLIPSELEDRSAAAELFMPDSGFISCRIAVVAYENKMDGADEGVTDLVVHACQVFVKNIITAMISRKKGYKIRDGKFQYGFNQAIPDPLIRNFNNIVDDTQESKIEVCNDDFLPKCKSSLETAEQQVVFSYSCAKRRKTDNLLTTALLYDTLRNNPRILGLYGIQSVNMLRLGVQLQE